MAIQLILALSVLTGIGSLACFVFVIVKMFQNNETTMAIVCLVLIICGIGPLIALVYGWINSGKWGIQTVMMAWTALIVVGILLQIAAVVMGVVGAAPGV